MTRLYSIVTFVDYRKGLLVGEPSSIRTGGAKCVVDVCQRDDTGRKRYFLSLASVRISAPVIALIDSRGDLLDALEDELVVVLLAVFVLRNVFGGGLDTPKEGFLAGEISVEVLYFQ